jgi:hypothetical protein
MRSILVSLLALFVSGCVSVPTIPATLDGQRIVVSYQPGGPVCFPCESLEIVMTSDGRAVWTHGYGTYREWNKVHRSLKFSAADFQMWRTKLAAFRPSGNLYFGADEKLKTCDVAYFDMPSRRIEWQDHRRTDRLVLDLGCDPEKHAKLLEFFDQFPALIGVKRPPKTDQWVATTPAQ